MKGISTLIVLTMATQLLFAQTPSVQEYISKDKAAFILNLSPYSTYKKLDTATTNKYNISELLTPILWGMAGNEAQSEEKLKSIQESLANPETMGLETQKEVYFWAQKPGDTQNELYAGETNPMFINIVLPITDGAKFRKFLDNLFGEEKTKVMIPSGNAMNLIHDKTLVNWNNKRLIISVSTIQQSFFEDAAAYESRIIQILLQHANALGLVTPETSIAKDAEYQKHLHKDSDFDVWMDYNNFMPSIETVPAEFRELYQSIIAFAGDIKIGGNGFVKKGELEFLMEMYTSDAMSRVLNAGYKTTLNKNFFKYLDNTNLMGMYSISMNVDGFMRAYGSELYKILETTKEGTLITNALDIVDIFVDEDEIYQLFKGDMVMAMTDLKIVERTSTDFEYNEEEDKWNEVTSSKKEVLPVMVMMMSCNEENILKFIKLATNAGALSKRDEGVWLIPGGMENLGFDVFVILQGGILMFTNDENLVTNAKSGIAKNKQMPSKDAKALSSYVQYVVLDAGKIAAAVKKAYESMDEELPRGVNGIEKTIQKFEIKTLKPNGNELMTEFRLKMTDPNANVLQTIVDGFLKMSEMDFDKGSSPSFEEAPVEEDGTKKL